MAEDAFGGRQRRTVFSLSTSDLGTSKETDSCCSSTDDLATCSKNRLSSRFRVARVDSEEEAAGGDALVELNPYRKPILEHRGESTVDYMDETGTCHEMHMTFGRNTLETLPHADHYRNLLTSTIGISMRKRPTLLELHELVGQEEFEEEENRFLQPKNIVKEDAPNLLASAVHKFGWIKGVLMRCLLNIFGVMLFLRLPWVVAQAGIGLASVIILLASVVTTLTALSMSAICTNGEVKGGGAYYMISRCLGPEFGGAIGIIFSIANAVATAMYIVGFAETIVDILKDHNCLMVDEINDVRIIGLITSVVILAIALAGLSWESRAQVVLLAVLTIAIVDIIIGTFVPTSADDKDKGFLGYDGKILVDNFYPDFRDGHDFFSVFAIFFPAATGILAGANISGDLKDAQKAIPKGTLLAIFITTLVYLGLGWMAGSCLLRDAPGPLITAAAAFEYNVLNSTTTVSDSVTSMPSTQPFQNVTFDVMNIFDDVRFCPEGECKYGIQNDMQVMQLLSLFGPITIAGIISATLSSALASLVSAPKVFQAVCKDKIFPYISIFAEGYGKNKEPWRAYILAFVIAIACVCIGELNAIAPLISNFFLMSYALINYSCVDASLAKSPGWRPAFAYYSLWLSLLGSILCVVVMFIINWWTALLTIGLVAVLYFYVHYRKPDINWGSSTQAHVYRNALQSTQKLTLILEHVKNFRPQLLVLTGFPSERPALVDFCSSFTKNVSMMVCAQVHPSDSLRKLSDLQHISKMAYKWLSKRKIKTFYSSVTARSLRSGAQALMQSVGVGKLKPNTLILGFKANWQTASSQELVDYFNIFHDAFDLRLSVGVLRLQEGLNPPRLSTMAEEALGMTPQTVVENADGTQPSMQQNDAVTGALSDTDCYSDVETKKPGIGGILQESVEMEEDDEAQPSRMENDNMIFETDKGKEYRKDIVNRFRHKQKKGFVDVWWLFDDGGLTLLVPYLMTTQKIWGNCRLRIFMAGTKNDELHQDQRQMAALLHKFRINYSSMKVLSDVGCKPQPESIQSFENMIKDWTEPEEESSEKVCNGKISAAELKFQKSKTYRHIRLRELLLKHSSDASVIVMTLPMPRKGLCSAALYMAWLDTLTRDMPPILLLRGNQENVLTYYS